MHWLRALILWIVSLQFFLIALAVLFYFMGSHIRDISGFFFSHLQQLYKYHTDGEVTQNDHYSCIRHSRPFVVYQGVKTSVPISVFGDRRLPKEYRVFLQRRGYRTGLLGWTMGSILGGSKLPGLEVSPEKQEPWAAHPQSKRERIDNDIARILPATLIGAHILQQTMIIHIPVSSGDGYFRLRITPPDNPHKTLCASAAFRIGSATWSSAHPQGASPLGLVPEVLVGTAFVAAKSAAFASFYAAFPLLKLAEWTPGPWRQFAMRQLYQRGGGAELNERFQIASSIGNARGQFQKMNDSVYRTVPFGAVGVRTTADLQKDVDLGRGGVAFDRTTG